MFSSVRVYLVTARTHFKRINKHTGTDIPWHMEANCDFPELKKKNSTKDRFKFDWKFEGLFGRGVKSMSIWLKYLLA